MRKKLLLSICTLLFASVSFAQYVLQTPDGKTVKLNKNGTWKYVNNNIITNSKRIPAASTAAYISKSGQVALWYDPSLWLYDTTKTTKGYWWQATFSSTDYAITGYYLESRLSAPVNNIEPYIENQYAGLGTIKSFSSYKDTINNIPLTCFDMELETNDILYDYKGYVFSSLYGSFQFSLGTQKEVFIEDKQKIIDLLNGIARNNTQ